MIHAVLAHQLHGEVEVERHGGYEVDDVDRTAHEVALLRTHQKPDEYLDGEPYVAHDLDVEKGRMSVRRDLLEHPVLARMRRQTIGQHHRYVGYHRHAHVRMRLKAERQYGHAYEHY